MTIEFAITTTRAREYWRQCPVLGPPSVVAEGKTVFSGKESGNLGI
jgi:hypothetical protein